MNEPFKKYWWFMAYGMLLIWSSYPATLQLMNSFMLNQKPEMRAFLGVIALLGFIIAMTQDVSKETREMAAQKPKSSQTEAKQRDKEESEMILCRFCGKKYSAEYNGCPHCKKK